MYKTIQRDEILKIFQNNKNHLTATDIYCILNSKVPQISLGTIYRNLELLAEQGIISQVKSYSKQKHFESNTAFHLHVRCPVCDEIKDLQDFNPKIIKSLSSLSFESYSLEFTQTCPNCKEHLLKQKIVKKQPLSLKNN